MDLTLGIERLRNWLGFRRTEACTNGGEKTWCSCSKFMRWPIIGQYSGHMILLTNQMPVLLFTDNSASEIVAKFRDLPYDETTLSPDYEDPSSSSDEDSTDPAVTTPITTPSPPPASFTSPASTTEDRWDYQTLYINSFTEICTVYKTMPLAKNAAPLMIYVLLGATVDSMFHF